MTNSTATYNQSFGTPDMHIFFIQSITVEHTHIEIHTYLRAQAYLVAFFMSAMRSLHTETIDPNCVHQ